MIWSLRPTEGKQTLLYVCIGPVSVEKKTGVLTNWTSVKRTEQWKNWMLKLTGWAGLRSLCLSVSLCLSHTLSFACSLSVSLSLHPSLSLYLSLSLSLCLSLSLSDTHTLSVARSLPLCLCLSVSPPLSLSLSLSLSFSVSLSVSLSLALCLSISLSLSLFSSLSLSLSLSLSHPHTHPLSLSLSHTHPHTHSVRLLVCRSVFLSLKLCPSLCPFWGGLTHFQWLRSCVFFVNFLFLQASIPNSIPPFVWKRTEICGREIPPEVSFGLRTKQVHW